jgi:hypothetical protein
MTTACWGPLISGGTGLNCAVPAVTITQASTIPYRSRRAIAGVTVQVCRPSFGARGASKPSSSRNQGLLHG